MSLDATQKKEAIRKTMLDGLPARIADYLAEVHTNGSIDDKRKALEFQSKVLGLEHDERRDATASLPVFNFVFHNGGMQAVMVPSTPTLPAAQEPETLELDLGLPPVEAPVKPALPEPPPIDMGELDRLLARMEDH